MLEKVEGERVEISATAADLDEQRTIRRKAPESAERHR